MKIRKKYRKWLSTLPPKPEINYIGDNPNVSFEMKMIFFVNNEFPLEEITYGVFEAGSSWLYKNMSNARSVDWFRRKTKPMIYKVYDTEGMEVVIDMHKNLKFEVFTMAGLPLAICLGPMWTNEILMYNNNYEQLTILKEE